MQDVKNENEIIKEFLTLPDIAKYLGVHVTTIYRYIKDEKNPLPRFELNNKTILVKKNELDAWLENYRKEQ